ncbi:hypothetical protein [Desulforamulus aquiferis]|uniref:Uncharacterized protein n=1 Tax=Desulforamulus aquiferis TaxID=1397668 RepID=A0AAW7ZCT5_9FIRM|nr:hypothetical protein [Desulforamulus aquiferis]MDO7787502.1 hypothetical protein [Desulforamulus aquiferis]
MVKKVVINASEKYLAKKEREVRIKGRFRNQKINPTNKDLYEYLNDTNARLSEIYDLLKEQDRIAK